MREVLIPPVWQRRRLPAPAADDIVYTLSGETMGTKWCVKFTDRPNTSTRRIEQRIQFVLDRVVAQMSPWREDSDLCRFNRAAAGTWVRLPDELFEVLTFALEVARATAGAYDPTLGALVNGWGFGPCPRGAWVPDSGTVRWWRTNTGWPRLEVDRRERRTLQEGRVSLDLCGIAKGYAVDLVARELERLSWGNYLVEVGGELRGRGVKPDTSPWWVELEAPPDAAGQLGQTIVALAGSSIATSGDYHRYFDVDGRRYSHTIDPRTGYPVNGGVASVTVLAGECMAADAWSTALTVMGVDAGLQLADRLGLAARLICRSGSNWTAHTSQAYRAMLD